jgi:carbonic anhydrase
MLVRRLSLLSACIAITALAVAQGDRLRDLLPKHPTMEEVAVANPSVVKYPRQALALLKEGNAMFYSSAVPVEKKTAYERRLQMLGQAPHSIILSCSDSRVPPEIIFEQGPGDLFIVRVAGNAADPTTMGSIDYGIEHLHSKLLVVMGHEACGAVKASMLSAADQAKESPYIQHILKLVSPATKDMPKLRDDRAKMLEATIRNIRYQVSEVMKDPVVQKAVAKGELEVVGAYYEIGSGAVDFLDTPEELKVDGS